jgi:predicted nucleic acid-binding protein
VFLDTSGLYALADEAEPRHEAAAARWRDLLGDGADLVTHNYVIVEATALFHRRLGKSAVGRLTDELLAPVETRWVTPSLHAEAISSFRGSAQAGTSLVDYVSFAVMRSESLATAFAFDDDFLRAGFETIP